MLYLGRITNRSDDEVRGETVLREICVCLLKIVKNNR
jgi:hypothetical protein